MLILINLKKTISKRILFFAEFFIRNIFVKSKQNRTLFIVESFSHFAYGEEKKESSLTAASKLRKKEEKNQVKDFSKTNIVADLIKITELNADKFL